MEKVLVHKNSNFTVMCVTHLQDKALSLKAKGLLSLMLSLPPMWNYSVLGLQTLGKDGKDSIKGALFELEKLGYLVRERVSDEKGRFVGCNYHIYEKPLTENPPTENPPTENPPTENPPTENPPQFNIKKSNIKELFINELRKKEKEENIKEEKKKEGVYVQTGTGCAVELPRGIRSNGYGVAVQTDIKDSSIKDNSIKDIITYLNSAISAHYRYQSEANKRHIQARLNEGYTVEDFKAVIDKKVAEWKGTEMAQYLRPETLFGSKFESYLNAPQTTVKTASTHFNNERQYTKAEMDALITDIDDIDF